MILKCWWTQHVICHWGDDSEQERAARQNNNNISKRHIPLSPFISKFQTKSRWHLVREVKKVVGQASTEPLSEEQKKIGKKSRSDEIQKRIVHMVPTIWLIRNKPLLKTSWTSQLQSLNANKMLNSTVLGYLDSFVYAFIYHSGASTWVAFVTNICDRSYHICGVG